MAARRPELIAVKDTATAAAAVAAVPGSPPLRAVVTGRGGKVVGTVTDGMLRRASLSDGSLSMPVASVMARRPLTASAKTKAAALDARLREHRERSLALLDDNGKGVGVRRLADRQVTDAVLMVGGRGERLRPLTDKVPKPLLRLGASTILERLITMLAGAGVTDVYLTLNYKADAFEERLGDGAALGVTMHYVREQKALGSAGALSLVADQVNGPCFVGNGDIVTTVDFSALFDYHWHHGGALTITGVEHLSHIRFGVLRLAEHHVLAIDEKPSRRDLINAGMYVLEPEVMRFVPH
ncbi:MAG: hypothetical protein QOG03_2454, partial [Actinomycetota bacterium]|nr:hypothetical protein [Actinomycetota bacterium]